MSPLLDGFPRTSDAPALAPADHATRAPIEGPLADGRADLVEKDVEYELRCRACGRYTRYAYWR